MKKLIIITLVFAIFAAFGAIAYAEGTSDEEFSPVGDTTEGTETPTETTETTEEDGEGVADMLSGVLAAPFWATAVSILATLAGCVAIFKNKFSQITAGIGNAATRELLTAQTGSLASEIKTALGERTEKISGDITAMLDNYKLLLTCFTVFIESAKINNNAKKEILNYLTGVKGVSDNVTETVTEALKAIEEANAAEPVIETPKTDAALANTPTMLLG